MLQQLVPNNISIKNEIEPLKFAELLNAYLTSQCFSDIDLISSNPYKRYVRKKDITQIDFAQPVTIDEIYSNKNLIIHKILLTIYEQDLLFLNSIPQNEQLLSSFKEFYDPDFIALGKFLKPQLEYLAFDFLQKEIEIIGHWNKIELFNYLTSVIAKQELDKSDLCEAIISAIHPALAAKLLLIQMAPDFLSEASAMGRALLGSFGQEQSELMKIFIDEYGYGVHQEKHSTLFEKTMISANLIPTIHYYFNDYLPTSLMLVNYFHYLCSNKAEWFKYLGALYYTEASIPHFNKQLSAVLKKCIVGIDTRYFDEHVHIDKHHRRMVLDKIITPSVEKYGTKIIDEILSGFESFKLIQALADQDVIHQIQFINRLTQKNELEKYDSLGDSFHFQEMKGEITTSHLHSEDEYFRILDGTLTFYPSLLYPLQMQKDEAIIIPKGRLHSTLSQSDDTSYTVQAIQLKGIYD